MDENYYCNTSVIIIDDITLIAVIEYVGPKYRTLVANMSFGIYFAAAASLLPWIAYWIADWRILSVVTAFPMIVAFLGPWLVPESARYLSLIIILNL